MIENFIKDMVKYVPAQVVPGIVGFISIPIITRLFPPADYGSYSLVMATVAVLTTLLGWLPISIIRFYPAFEKDKKLDIFYGNIVKLGGISMLVVTAIFCLILFSAKAYFSPNLYLLMYVGIGVFCATAIFNAFQYVLASKREVGWYSRFAVWKSITGFGFGLSLMLLFKLNVEALLLGIILSLVIVLPLLWRKAIGTMLVVRSKINLQLAKEMAKYSFPLVVGNLAAWILSLSDRYILQFFRGAQEVGIYSASYNIIYGIMGLLATLFMLAGAPIGMSIWERQGENGIKKFICEQTRFYLIFCLPAVVGLSVLAKPIIEILTTQQYYEGYRIIPLVVSGCFFLGLQHRFQWGFSLYKKTVFISVAMALSGLLNLFLNFLLIPQYGYMIAAITTLISYGSLLFLMIIVSRRFFVWQFPFNSLAKATCAAAIMGIVVYFISGRLPSLTLINLIVSVCLGGLIYSTLLFLFREFQPKEKEIIGRVLVKYLPLGLIPKNWEIQK